MLRDSGGRRFLSSRPMGERIEGERPQSQAAQSAGRPCAADRGARARRARCFPDGAAKHWLLSSIIWLTVVDLFGLVLATEFVTPGGLRRDLVAVLQPDPARARERRDPRVADDDVLRRALLHAAAPRRHARDVERAARHLLRLGLEPDVPARDHRVADRPQPGPGVRRVHLADRHRPARHLVRERREHPGDRRDPDDPADLRLRLVLHREPALAGRRLRDRQRDLAARATSGARRRARSARASRTRC